ncbi:hypothetical protein [Leucobacter denitrificans]|uniref:Uncharacterized protein n=1 Tax=Leucobacter denitrificans TaxID=683042 RepID=A0A7G9S461_9MICO|nr:hypothetical protein [Leucobacter denitrificans]QNN62636.1 hypothetical protein H9L06_10450 [Leucobacter denitrificans]
MESATPSQPEDGEVLPEEGSDGLLDRLELIESQPLEHRAAGFEQLHDALLAELQRSDHDGA